MKLFSISSAIEEYINCKICGAHNIYNVTKHKQGVGAAKKPRGTKNIISIKNEQVFVTEEGPYKVWLSDEILDIKENSYVINAVKDYVFDQIIFRLALVCSNCASISSDEEGEDKHIKSGKFLNDDDEFYDTTDSSSHYEAVFYINIDQKTKEITSVNINSEWLENEEFTINKNFANNSTKIIKKQRGIRLPFIYDKNFKEFDFGKLLAISNLLK
jgi:hypothetical protein